MIYDVSIEMSSVREIDIKNRKYYFFGDMIKINNLNPNKIKINKNSSKNILIFDISCVAPNREKL